ncbi:lipopolysaccharide assembly protein LapB [Oceanicoccus sp. KOV_DT_Chl]|uniref:lipopolysaccharide assembly protein LapB n=1 Tax=Oceanicoccus sp. KOV_DT_Chl TaxID=1904639 RepID=UPI000C7BE2C0|nr:lipopolysaccharide assembly protein LapB [Oceanicoccus sp. KOV_DT_Chl]
MFDPWQLLLVVSAIAIGWLLGRKPKIEANDVPAVRHHQYYKGLNFLLNDQPDGALDTFIEALEVNSETLETHIAIGNLMRRKGEVERAIRIHQNLLSRPSLSRVHLHQAHLELARDFISAGLWDRAEGLLLDLIKDAPELKAVAMRHLLEIYQDEKEWQQAIDTAKQLLPKRYLLKASPPVDASINDALAHYCCELAELALQKKDFHSTRNYLKQALSYDRSCVRASLLAAEVEYRTGHLPKAIQNLRKVWGQDPVFIPETVPLLKACYQKLDDDQAFQNDLKQALDICPSVTTLLALVELIKSKQGDLAATEFLGKALAERPSLRGLAKFVELHIDNSGGRARENFSILQLLIEQLLEAKPQYQCQHCGFAGKHLHWLCPGCKHWGQVKAIRGAEGD